MAITYPVELFGDITEQTARTAPTDTIGALIHWTTIPAGFGGAGAAPIFYIPPLARVTWYYNAPTSPPGGSLWGTPLAVRYQRQRFYKMTSLETLLLITPRPGLVGVLYWIVDTP